MWSILDSIFVTPSSTLSWWASTMPFGIVLIFLCIAAPGRLRVERLCSFRENRQQRVSGKASVFPFTGRELWAVERVFNATTTTTTTECLRAQGQCPPSVSRVDTDVQWVVLAGLRAAPLRRQVHRLRFFVVSHVSFVRRSEGYTALRCATTGTVVTWV